MIAALIDAEFKEKQVAWRVVGVQALGILVLMMVVWLVVRQPQVVVAVGSGGAVSVLNGILLAWRMSRSVRLSIPDVHLQLRLMYYYAAERFLVAMLLLAVCLVALKLPPLAMMGGFVVGQVLFLVARLFYRIRLN
jgi:hypothetical protein